MQNPQGGGIAIEPDDRNNAYRSVVSDVISLIEHVQASLRLIEQEIARETASGGQETSTNVIVLDDVTPPYVRATAALKACDANLATPSTPCSTPRPRSTTPAIMPGLRRRFRSSAREGITAALRCRSAAVRPRRPYEMWIMQLAGQRRRHIAGILPRTPPRFFGDGDFAA